MPDTAPMDLTTTLFELSLYLTFIVIAACAAACFMGETDAE